MPPFSVIARTLLVMLCPVISNGVAASAATGSGAVAGLTRASEHVLYSFQGFADGGSPSSTLLNDGAGGFFGTTQVGGGGSCGGGCGTVFHLTPGAGRFVERIVHAFSASTDGTTPEAGLVADSAGALYGTTAFGGSACFNPGCGVVFKLTPQKGGADGGNPSANVSLDARGDVIGTTTSGGTGGGVVFELTFSAGTYKESVLHAFGARAGDGTNPAGGLLVDPSGRIFGLTVSGGASGHGTAYGLAPAKNGYAETVLYSFTGGQDGSAPSGALAFGPGGVLYGTTYSGGRDNTGVVFSLSPEGNAYAEKAIHSFTKVGAEPAGGVYVDKAGAIYGTTAFGGLPGCTNGGGCGMVFGLIPAGAEYTYEILHVFGGGRDASEPLAGLTPGPHGEFYGTTLRGGTGNYGTVFRIK